MAVSLRLVILGCAAGPALGVAWLWLGRAGLRGPTRAAAAGLAVIACFQSVFWTTAGLLSGFNRPATFAVLGAMVVAGGLAHILTRSSRAPEHRAAGDRPAGSGAVITSTDGEVTARLRRFAISTLAALLGVSAALLLFRSLVNYPFLPDDHGYHLVSPLWWIQNGALTDFAFEMTPDMTGYYSPVNGYPRSFEAVAALLALWSGNLASTCLTWLGFFLPGLLATWSLLGRWRVGPGFRLMAVLLICSHPLVQLHAGSLYTDVATASLFACALLFLLRWLDDNAPVDAALLGTCVGLLAGLKVSGAVHAALLVAVGVACQLAWKGRRPRQLAAPLVALAGPALLCGGAWYLYNLGAYGNPFHPVTVEWKGLAPSFDGPLSSLIFTDERLLHPWRTLAESLRDPGWFWTAGGATHGLGPWFAAFGLPAVVLAPWVTRRYRAEVLLVSWVVVCAFLAQPMRWYPRFILFAVWCAAILICALGSRLQGMLKPALVGCLALCVVLCLLVGWPQTLLKVAVALDHEDLESWTLGSQPWNLTTPRLLWHHAEALQGSTILVPSYPEVLARCQSPDLAYRLVAYDPDDLAAFTRRLAATPADFLLVVPPAGRPVEGRPADAGHEVWEHVWSRPDQFRPVAYQPIPVEWSYRPSLLFWDALFELRPPPGAHHP